jgi:hypothetical protein
MTTVKTHDHDTAEALADPRLQQARSQFRALLVSNPNYFGNLELAEFQPVMPLIGNTFYEQITCVGFNPQFDRLEGVVRIKQTNGYLGDLCSLGSGEHVRFFLSYDNGATWQDQGMKSFTVHDMGGPRPLDYDVHLEIQPDKRRCEKPNLPLVRAILSWNLPPPAGDPTFKPVWGNVLETRIQIAPKVKFYFKDLITANLPQLDLLPAIDEEETLAVAAQASAPVYELAKRYGDSVPAHRFAFPYVQSLFNPGVGSKLITPMAPLAELLPGLNLNDILGAIQQTDGNTTYEELRCIGFDLHYERLAGVIHVKKPSGYAGDLCEAGSREYVAFWVDWGTGSGWDYIGTTSVAVHDINIIPPEGLRYSVSLPVNTTAYRQACHKGPKIVRMRAILSWGIPPAIDPNFVPTWGNREETLIQLLPGDAGGEHIAFIELVSGVPTNLINNVGYASGDTNGAAPGGEIVDAPFGGLMELTGQISAFPPDVLNGGAQAFKYRVWLGQVGGTVSWQPLYDKFYVSVTEYVSGVPTILPPIEQSADISGWYTYLEDPGSAINPANPQRSVANKRLAVWNTLGKTGHWKVRIEAMDPATSATWWSNEVDVRIDNAAPTVTFDITSGSGNCGDFVSGDPISGTYSVSDEHFGSMSFAVLPGSMGGTFTAPNAAQKLYTGYGGAVPSAGGAGSFTLDTTGMAPCGYVLRYHVSDRTIVGYHPGGNVLNVSYTNHSNLKDVGLCLD